MEGSIIALIFMIIMIITHIIKSIKEAGEAVQQQRQQPVETEEEEPMLVVRSKPNKPPKGNKQRSLVRQPSDSILSILDDADSKPFRRQALSKTLAPQGDGQRFDADPGTLDTAQIVAPTIDPTVRPELESITGIYEEGALFTDKSNTAITLDIAHYFAKPEGIVHAVILAEILNRPAWQESPQQQV
jgi:hypothetical protein